MNEIKELEELIEKIEVKYKELTFLKKTIKQLKNRCWICGYPALQTKEGFITKHSIKGKHKKPHIYLCRSCHDCIEIWKIAIKIMKKEKRLTINRFNQIVKTFTK